MAKQTSEGIPARKNEKSKTDFLRKLPSPIWLTESTPAQSGEKKKEYTIVVTGCTGRGKSTFCNFLSRSNKFKPEALPGSKTGWGDFGGWGAAAADLTGTQCHVVKDLLGEFTVRIIDLPGYLATQNRTGNDKDDLAKDGRMVLDEFAEALVYAKDGIDAIFIALRAAERYTKEEELLMEFISHLQLWDHCILLFTHGDRAGKDEGRRYKEFYAMIRSRGFPDQCPVLHKMLKLVKDRFVIVESIHCKGDHDYYLSKVEELHATIDLVCCNTGSAIRHPLLNLARSAFEASQIKLDMQVKLEKMTEEKGKIQEELEQARTERERWEKDYNCLQAELEREKAKKTGGAPQVMKDKEGLQDAELNPSGDDKQDTAATARAHAVEIMKNLLQSSTGPEQIDRNTYAQLSRLADDHGKMMEELNGLMHQLQTGIGLAFKKGIARKINDILRKHDVEVSGDHSTIVCESNEGDTATQTEDASRQPDRGKECKLF